MATEPRESVALQQLARLAADRDAAWHELVEQLTPVLSVALSDIGVLAGHREQVMSATWRALSRRLELAQPPADVADWLRDRASIEARRLARAPLPVSRLAEQAIRHPSRLPDRRQVLERRHATRGTGERRRIVEPTWSPDVLAAWLRRGRASDVDPP
jgi:hypothetical protein